MSVAPIKTTCGSYHLYIALDGKQRETTMRINRTEEGGGNFVAPLAAIRLAISLALWGLEVLSERESGAHSVPKDGWNGL